MYFQICWQQFGYGLNITPAECDDMQLGELFWYRERVAKQREKK